MRNGTLKMGVMGMRTLPNRHIGTYRMELWGNYGLSDGGMVHGWIAANRSWDASKPNFEARVHGDGIPGNRVWSSCANKPCANLNATY